MRHIHIEWLRSWLESNRKSRKSKHHTVVIYNAITWELCKQDFPVSMKRGYEILGMLYLVSRNINKNNKIKEINVVN